MKFFHYYCPLIIFYLFVQHIKLFVSKKFPEFISFAKLADLGHNFILNMRIILCHLGKIIL